MSAKILPFPLRGPFAVRVEPERGLPSYLVVTRRHGWAFGDRAQAIAEGRALARDLRTHLEVQPYPQRVDRRCASGVTRETSQTRETKMDLSKYASKSYIGLEDVRRKGKIRATIIGVTEGSYDKPVLDLGLAGKFACNKTNTRTLIDAVGSDDSEALIGVEVELTEGRIKYQKTETEAVVIRPLLTGEANDAPVKRKKADDGMDDEIPF
jgi:hypothetical protein